MLETLEKKAKIGIIEDLEYKKDAIILVKKDIYKSNPQYPYNVINYIKEKYKLMGEIELFDIYCK